MFSSLHLALSFSPHVLTISVCHVLITTYCSVFLSTCPDHLSLPCSHYYILLCLSLHMSQPSQSSMLSLLHLALSFSLHVLTISVFHVLITTSCSVVLSTCDKGDILKTKTRTVMGVKKIILGFWICLN